MNESLIFQAEAFPAESEAEQGESYGPSSHANLGPAKNVARDEVEGELRATSPAQHPTLGPGRVVPRSSVSLELADEAELIGTDDRVQVTDTTAVPYRWACHLDLFFPDPDNPANLLQFVGSGTLIGPKHVLTAGHCLFDDVTGSAGTNARVGVQAITVTPGRSGGSSPLGSSTMASF